MKVTNEAEFRAAAEKLVSLREDTSPESMRQQFEISSAMKAYSDRTLSQSAGRGGNYSGYANGSDALGNAPRAASERMRFVDPVSGAVMNAIEPGEPIAPSAAHGHGWFGESLVCSMLGDEARSRRLSNEVNDTLAPTSAQAGNVGARGGVFIGNTIQSVGLDLARAATVCTRAGARTVPMPSGTVTVVKLLTDPTAEWRGEGQPIEPSSSTFGSIVVVTKNLGGIVTFTRELLADAPNAASMIETAAVAMMAGTLDLYALRGTASGAAPTGLKNTSGINTLDFASVTGTPYRPISRAIRQILDANYPGELNRLAWLGSPSTFEEYDSLVDQNDQPLMPTGWASQLRKFQTTAIPNTLGSGDESECYIGDFSEMVFFVRQGIEAEVLREGQVVNTMTGITENLLRENKIALRLTMRADVAVMRPAWFTYISGVNFSE